MNKLRTAFLLSTLLFLSMSSACYARHGNTGVNIVLVLVFAVMTVATTENKNNE